MKQNPENDTDLRRWAGQAILEYYAKLGYTYRKTDVDARDLAEIVAYLGFFHLARRHWRTGMGGEVAVVEQGGLCAGAATSHAGDHRGQR